jgi:hypothetical protein
MIEPASVGPLVLRAIFFLDFRNVYHRARGCFCRGDAPHWEGQVDCLALGQRLVARPLRYPAAYPREKPEEKGIDVALAVDFVMMAARDEYDVGILMSTDTDYTVP